MPQFRILIAVMVETGEFPQASMAGTDYVMAIRSRTQGIAIAKDVRVLKIEDVSPPSFDPPLSSLSAHGGVSTGASV